MRLPETDALTVRNSSFVTGELGVFTRRAFEKGAVLFRVEGPVVPRPTKYSFAAGFDKHIEPMREDGISDFGHYMNHSCDPNVIVRPAECSGKYCIEVIARQPIRADEELAFDYASLEYEVTVSNASCRCGSILCRKRIHGFKDLPLEIVQLYQREGLIPQYLLDLLHTAQPRRAASG